jgi:hypothetical protein
MIMQRYIVVFCFLFFPGLLLTAYSQPNLMLSKPGKRHHFFYQVGDRITYKDKSTGRKISGAILIMTDSSIELAHAPRINFTNIETVYRTRHFFSQAAAAGVVVLGLYVPISILNRAFQHQHPLINEDIYYVNGPMLAVSGISMLLVNRKFHIGEHWRLQVIDFGHPVYN